jgi:hypothetical protein
MSTPAELTMAPSYVKEYKLITICATPARLCVFVWRDRFVDHTP